MAVGPPICACMQYRRSGSPPEPMGRSTQASSRMGRTLRRRIDAKLSGSFHSMSATIAEFIGTALLVTFGNGVVANVVLSRTKGNNSGWIVITAGWGLAVFVGVFCSQAVSGAHLNPAVTLAMAQAG